MSFAKCAYRIRRKPITSLLVCLALAITTGCSDSDDGEVTQSDDSPAVLPSEGETGQTPIPDALDEPITEVSDPDGDDQPGLVVTGLDGQSAQDVVSPWLVNTFIFRNPSFVPPSVEAGTSLVPYRDDFPVAAHVDFYTRELDTCELRRAEADPGNGGDGGSAPLSISGGSSVTINSPSGPWLVLEQRIPDDGSGVFYNRPFSELAGALPEGATLSIPGDVFPNVAAYPLTEPSVPVRVSPNEDGPLTADTVYQWVPENGTDYVDLSFIAFNPETGNFIDFPLVCSVVDDGSFEMPADARAFIEGTTDELRLRYERVRQIVELSNGIVFRTSTAVAE